MTLWFFLVAVLPEVVVALLLLRPILAKKMRRENVEAVLAGEWDEAIERVVKPLRERIEGLSSDVEAGEGSEAQAWLEDFEGRFSEAYKADMEAMRAHVEGMAQRIKMETLGNLGVEERFFRRAAEEAETEIVQDLSVMEAVASEDPRILAATIGQKIDRLGEDDEWKKKHPIGDLILDVGKPTLKRWVGEMTRQLTQAENPLLEGRAPRRIGSGGKTYG